MKKLKIQFEGITFIANIISPDTIRITNDFTTRVNKQMFFHIKETLIKEISSGKYSKEIELAIIGNKTLLL